jgi:hypothetical protein
MVSVRFTAFSLMRNINCLTCGHILRPPGNSCFLKVRLKRKGSIVMTGMAAAA